ncbi:hypothetical protein [Paenibacillus campinasensis]|uniref:PD(D/E)XK endonuclease domain-containing protein n=1 Tax=Paenibacillus campinasensis TaxID=66347 RepID=A0A268EH12_9BACL|nr:hypothetical protein [Paenibacillus campinasensis]PAD72410.1 hypothetical protein CHH67_22480 [Paenibacillus campinasensis]
MIYTAHISEVVGKYSELVAQIALLANGWRVHESKTAEAYDILATDPVSGEFAKIQVKTIRQRMDRGGDLVVYAKKGNGTAYDRADADLIIGVWVIEGEAPRVFIFENRLCGEYWASEARASERWIELPLALNRSIYEQESA